MVSVINDMRCWCVDSICLWFGSIYGFSKLSFGFKKVVFALIQSWIMYKIAFNDFRWACCTFWKSQSCYLHYSHLFRTGCYMFNSSSEPTRCVHDPSHRQQSPQKPHSPPKTWMWKNSLVVVQTEDHLIQIYTLLLQVTWDSQVIIEFSSELISIR